MPARAQHRDAIVRAAALLFRRSGYAATGTNRIVAASGAPKGSLYHYFPGGKEQIAEETVRYASGRVGRTLADLLDGEAGAGDALRAYGRLVGGWLRESGFRDGCPITTTLLELAPAADGVAAAGRDAFDTWSELLAARLRADGVDARRAQRLGLVAVAALEGALILAKVAGSEEPVIEALGEVADLFDTAARTS